MKGNNDFLFSYASETDLIQALVEEFRLNVPVIKDDEIYIAHAGETQVDVSGDPCRRFFYDAYSGPVYVPCIPMRM